MKRLFVIAILSVMGGFLASADTFRLKNGEVVEGTIIDNQPDHFLVKGKNAAGIGFEREIKKSDVLEHIVDTPDRIAFKQIEGYLPTPDRLTVPQYQKRLRDLQGFLNAFPDSPFVPDAKKMDEQLRKELRQAQLGGLKLDGEWIRPAQRNRNAYEIDAGLAMDDMKAAAKDNNHQKALLKFDEIVAEFPSTKYYVPSTQFAEKVLKNYQNLVKSKFSGVKAAKERREINIRRLPEAQRAAERAAIQARDKRYLDMVSAQKTKQGWRWVTLTGNDVHPGPMQDTLRNIQTTLDQIANVEEPEKDGGALYRAAYGAALQKNEEQARELITELKSLQVPDRYIERIEVLLQPEEDPNTPPPGPAPSPREGSETSADGSDSDPDQERERVDVEEDELEEASTPTSGDDGDDGNSKMKLILLVVMAIVIIGALMAAFGGKSKKRSKKEPLA